MDRLGTSHAEGLEGDNSLSGSLLARKVAYLDSVYFLDATNPWQETLDRATMIPGADESRSRGTSGRYSGVYPCRVQGRIIGEDGHPTRCGGSFWTGCRNRAASGMLVVAVSPGASVPAAVRDAVGVAGSDPQLRSARCCELNPAPRAGRSSGLAANGLETIFLYLLVQCSPRNSQQFRCAGSVTSAIHEGALDVALLEHCYGRERLARPSTNIRWQNGHAVATTFGSAASN